MFFKVLSVLPLWSALHMGTSKLSETPFWNSCWLYVPPVLSNSLRIGTVLLRDDLELCWLLWDLRSQTGSSETSFFLCLWFYCLIFPPSLFQFPLIPWLVPLQAPSSSTVYFFSARYFPFQPLSYLNSGLLLSGDTGSPPE